MRALAFLAALSALFAAPALAAPPPACGSTIVITGDQGAIYRPPTNNTCVPPLAPVTIDATAAGTRADRLYILGAKGIVVSGGTWGKDDAPLPAVTVDSSQFVRITGADVVGSAGGISFSRGSDYQADHNRIHRTRNDAIDITQSQRVVIDQNRMFDFQAAPGVHMDGIQIFSATGQTPVSDVDITNNTIDGDAQGIDNFGDGPGVRNLRVEGNLVGVTFWHGITLTNVKGLTLRRNIVATIPMATQGALKVSTWMRFDGSTDVVACDNVVPTFPTAAGTEACK
jgi:hypothetical protein